MPGNGKYPSKGMNKLASKRPDVAKKIKQLFCNCKTFTVVHAKFCKDCGAHYK